MPKHKKKPIPMEMSDGAEPRKKKCNVCSGDAPCPVNAICCPLVMPWRSCTIYCFPCVSVCCHHISNCLCKPCAKCFMYKDKNFPGVTKLLAGQGKGTKFVRARELATVGQDLALFRGVEPADVAQGALGDCWLLAAAACLAEFPGAIRNLFVNREASLRGKYQVRLYDDMKRKWTVVTVDDRFPCDGAGIPLFAQPHEGELWAMVLEKAFAKFCWGYDHLKGGLTLWALRAMTGDHVFTLKKMRDKHGGAWRRYDLVSFATEAEPRKCGLRKTEEEYDSESLWKLLLQYDRGEAIMAASITKDKRKKKDDDSSSSSSDDDDHNKDDPFEHKRDDGLVEGHAYTVISAKEVHETRLLQLRNPWGTFEWTGEWSDGSRLWKCRPEITKILWPARGDQDEAKMDDGSFWMPFDKFSSLFTNIDICDRSTGLKDLAFNIDEDQQCCGPVAALACGCCEFWCKCRGCKALYCHRVSSKETRKVRKRCPCLQCFSKHAILV